MRTWVRTPTVGGSCAGAPRIALFAGRTPFSRGTPCYLRRYPNGRRDTTPKSPDLLHRVPPPNRTIGANSGHSRQALPYVTLCFGPLMDLATRSRSASK
ncbi:hypothetical protein B7R77_09990 [Ralstonia solanacearum K60]|uniref:Uncharacterized protein n=1 Tax=Ralstonia solanacearum K60 TaxID=1091042 RepID=A0AAP7ZMX1_RALSL|nr:hypothetical protein B7R77_09990 [Ralstonia solanacearum K60]